MINPLLLAVGAILGIAQLITPRSLFAAPLAAATFLTPRYSFLFEFNTQRVVILIGIARLIATGRLKTASWHRIDSLLIFACALILMSSAFHEADAITSNPLFFRIRVAFDIITVYLYSRLLLQSYDDLVDLCRAFAVVAPLLAIPLLMERISGQNAFTFLGARLETSLVRDGRIRACGPFGTPILAGTVGALLIPMCAVLHNRTRTLATICFIASAIIVVSSSSSGPVGTAAIATGAIFAWRYRAKWRLGLAAIAGSFLFLLLFMDRPPWYILSMIDIVGGSTGWHRAKLIDASMQYLGDWFWWGTDFTRHWMPYGLPTVPNHCDLTNYFIHIGVISGFPAATIILYAFIKAALSQFRSSILSADLSQSRLSWIVASALVAVVVTGFTISFYDQGYVFPYIFLAAGVGVSRHPASAP